MKSTANKPWLFYALVAYVIMQFLWWEILLVKQSRQLAEQQKSISALHFADKQLLEENIRQIEKKEDRQLWMHVGEGTVFLIFLSLGVLKIYNTRQKENELNRLQSNFLLSVTHELKSPLASVKLQLQTLQKHTLDEATKNKLLQKALSDNERLLRMIDNILLASKTGNETKVLNLTNFNLVDALSKLIEQAFEESKHRIRLNADKTVFVQADETLTSIIFSNLIENALKYSPANTMVEINVSSKNDKAMVSVKDSGAGIADTEKGNVFTKFYRIGNEETRSAKGTGLGLFITKNLCDLQHIQIGISDNKPAGSIFTLSFS